MSNHELHQLPLPKGRTRQPRPADTYRGARRNAARETLKALPVAWSTGWQRSRATQANVKRLYQPPVRENKRDRELNTGA